MKRIISGLLAVLLLLSLAACGKKNTLVPSVTESGMEERTETQTPGNLPQMGADQNSDGQAAYEKTVSWLINKVPEPGFGSVGGEWLAMGLARSEMEGMEEYLLGYGERVAAHTAEQGGILHNRKYTEYSRVILAWTAIGRDATDVGGFNLLTPLADFEQTVFQGLNGPIYALIALDCGGYEIPENITDNTQATRDMYVDYIVNAEITDGGWSLSGGPAEIDMTAMALQALAKYQDRPDVKAAVERGLELLSQQQNVNGGFADGNGETSEAISQAIVALTELGISLDDSRFVKNGNTLKDALLRFQMEDGSFRHTMDGDTDLLSTEQAFYALVALDRMEQGKTSLYTMK